MDPTKRITSEQALQDPYFQEDPLPTLEYVPFLLHGLCSNWMVLYAAECQGNTSLTCSALLMKTAQRTSPQGKAHTSFLDESQKRTDTAQAQATPITMGAQDSLQAHSPFPSSCSGLVDIRKLFFFLEGKFIFMFKQNKVNLVWG